MFFDWLFVNANLRKSFFSWSIDWSRDFRWRSKCLPRQSRGILRRILVSLLQPRSGLSFFNLRRVSFFHSINIRFSLSEFVRCFNLHRSCLFLTILKINTSLLVSPSLSLSFSSSSLSLFLQHSIVPSFRSRDIRLIKQIPFCFSLSLFIVSTWANI